MFINVYYNYDMDAAAVTTWVTLISDVVAAKVYLAVVYFRALRQSAYTTDIDLYRSWLAECRPSVSITILTRTEPNYTNHDAERMRRFIRAVTSAGRVCHFIDSHSHPRTSHTTSRLC